ncbi:hypothetical protein [Streptomyces sp. CoH27]|uniref:hypothetical protein n=1 Tax=Streptomyces sp. CoH27 TaxID=2875763 RepID=UPI0035A86862
MTAHRPAAGLRHARADHEPDQHWASRGAFLRQPLRRALGRDRLKGLTGEDKKVLRLVGDLLGKLASRDLRARCAAGLEHDTERWARRKRVLAEESSSRWAGNRR